MPTRASACALTLVVRLEALERLDVRGGGALGALLAVVAHLRALGERLEAAALDRAVVNEQILAVVVRRDEAEALVVAEPFDGSCGHFLCLRVFMTARHGGRRKARLRDTRTLGRSSGRSTR